MVGVAGPRDSLSTVTALNSRRRAFDGGVLFTLPPHTKNEALLLFGLGALRIFEFFGRIGRASHNAPSSRLESIITCKQNPSLLRYYCTSSSPVETQDRTKAEKTESASAGERERRW